MGKYRRVTYEDRCHISALLQAHYSVPQIALATGFHKCTIYRELKRNSIQRKYSAEMATDRAAKRFYRCRRRRLLTEDLREEVRCYLAYGWSPEQISGRLKKEKKVNISHQTIYRGLPRKKMERRWLRRFNKRGAGRYCQRALKRTNKVFINERPSIVEQRRRIGDWERDGMYGANRQQLLILTDRKSRYTKIGKMGKGKSEVVSLITARLLEQTRRRVYTITNDNGTEFNSNASLPYKVFHCAPRKPNQRGTVENTIGLLRQYITRKTDLNSLTTNELLKIENKINFRPRKCLDYKTPFEVFFNTKVALVM